MYIEIFLQCTQILIPLGLILCMLFCTAYENRSHQVTSTIKAVPEEEGAKDEH